MNRLRFLLTLLAAWLTGPAALAATPPEKPIFDRDWIAGSTTAMGITGDMRMTPDSITFDGRVTYKLRFIEEKVSKEPESYWRNIPSFSLYEVVEPQTSIIRQGAGLCGGMMKPKPPHYLAVGLDAVNERLTLVTFESEAPPADIGLQIKGVCGSYGYFLEAPAKK